MKFLRLEKKHIDQLERSEKMIWLVIRIQKSRLFTVTSCSLSITHKNIRNILLCKNIFHLFSPPWITEKTVLCIHQKRDLLALRQLLKRLTYLIKTIISREKYFHYLGFLSRRIPAIRQIVPTIIARIFLISKEIPIRETTPCFVYCWYEKTMLNRYKSNAKPIYHRPLFFIIDFAAKIIPHEKALTIDMKIPTGKTLPYLLNSLTPHCVKSLTQMPENGAGLPIILSPRTKKTPIGISATLVEKKKRSIHWSFSEPTTSFLKNLRTAQMIPIRIPTK